MKSRHKPYDHTCCRGFCKAANKAVAHLLLVPCTTVLRQYVTKEGLDMELKEAICSCTIVYYYGGSLWVEMRENMRVKGCRLLNWRGTKLCFSLAVCHLQMLMRIRVLQKGRGFICLHVRSIQKSTRSVNNINQFPNDACISSVCFLIRYDGMDES